MKNRNSNKINHNVPLHMKAIEASVECAQKWKMKRETKNNKKEFTHIVQ